MFDLRSFYRNKNALDAIGIGYSWGDHQQYRQSLKEKGLKPMSLKGMLKTYGETWVGNMDEGHDAESDARLEANRPTIELYIESLEQATGGNVYTLKSTKLFASSLKYDFIASGVSYEGERQWQLSAEESVDTISLFRIEQGRCRRNGHWPKGPVEHSTYTDSHIFTSKALELAPA